MTTHAVQTVFIRFLATTDMNDGKNAFQKTVDLKVSPGVLGKACLLKVRHFYAAADASSPTLIALAADFDQPNHNSYADPGTATGGTSWPNIMAQHQNGNGSIIAITTTGNQLNNSEHATIPIQLGGSTPKVTFTVFNPFNSAVQTGLVAMNMVLQMEIIPLE